MIKYLREMSDCHMEFGPLIIPKLDTDQETILLLCGDMHVGNRIVDNDWLKTVSEQFAHVLYICGNHEHYKSSLDKTGQKIIDAIRAQQLHNVTFLNNEAFVIPDTNIKVFGGTMWADFNKGDPRTQHEAEQTMNDYRKIRCQNYEKRLKPRDLIVEHLKFKSALSAELASEWEGQIIVMTHHAPHHTSCILQGPEAYHENGIYSSDLSDIILKNPKIKYWFHGHTHKNSNYMIGDCNVICNPRGYYPNHLNPNFNDTLIIDLSLINSFNATF